MLRCLKNSPFYSEFGLFTFMFSHLKPLITLNMTWLLLQIKEVSILRIVEISNLANVGQVKHHDLIEANEEWKTHGHMRLRVSVWSSLNKYTVSLQSKIWKICYQFLKKRVQTLQNVLKFWPRQMGTAWFHQKVKPELRIKQKHL